MQVMRVKQMALALAVMLLAGGVSSALAQSPVILNGAGATFPYPLYSKWSQVYAAETGVQINYQSIGSGGGIRQFIAGLNFPPDVLADIFLGKVAKWNDPRLLQDNQKVALPAADIVVVHRSDGSGTSNIFTNYLSKVSPQWKTQVGEGTSVNWPTGLGGKGNEGVAGVVKQTPYALGYVELAYALTNKMPFGYVRNKAGQFVPPTLSSTSRAVDGALASIPQDYRVFFTNPDGKDAYPIAGFTWILIYGEQPDPVKGKALVSFLWWATHDGQKYAPTLLYAPLPKSLVGRIEKTLKTVTAQGAALLP